MRNSDLVGHVFNPVKKAGNIVLYFCTILSSAESDLEITFVDELRQAAKILFRVRVRARFRIRFRFRVRAGLGLELRLG